MINRIERRDWAGRFPRTISVAKRVALVVYRNPLNGGESSHTMVKIDTIVDSWSYFSLPWADERV